MTTAAAKRGKKEPLNRRERGYYWQIKSDQNGIEKGRKAENMIRRWKKSDQNGIEKL